MNSQALSLLKRWLPPAVYEKLTLLRARSKFLAYPCKHLLAKNSTLKNTASGRRAFLIAAGPSLKQEDLSVLAGEDCFALSNVYLHEQIGRINPRFHFFAPYHEPLTLESYVNWLASADNVLQPNTGIFLGESTFDIVTRYKLFQNRSVHYLYLSGSPPSNSTDITGPVLSPQTAPMMVLPVLAYMGYKEIYLLGCDHTDLRDYKKTVNYFYEPSRDVRKCVNSVTNVWYGGIVDNLSNTINVFRQYAYYKSVLNASGIKVVNLSRDSWLDLFETDTLENVIARR